MSTGRAALRRPAATTASRSDEVFSAALVALPISFVVWNPWGLTGRHEIRLLFGFVAVAIAFRQVFRRPEIRLPRERWLGAAFPGLVVPSGLDDISRIQPGARRGPFAIQQDDAAIAVAYVAHLLRQDDLSVRIIVTGVVGYGPWVGYLVPETCRDLRIPLGGHASMSDAERQAQSDLFGSVASRTLRELCARHDDGTSLPPQS